MRVSGRAVLLAAASLAYPLIVFFSLGRLAPGWIALLPLAIATLRLAGGRRDLLSYALLACACAVLVPTLLAHSALPLKFYPVLVSLAMLTVFGASLLHPPSLIERIARLREPDLPPAAVRYTRNVTRIWCGFFVLNGSIAAWTALAGSDRAWALYNGLISYLLMGALFAGEWLVRQYWRRRHER